MATNAKRRRQLIAGLGTTAAAVALGAPNVSAQTAPAAFEPSRYPQDDWFGTRPVSTASSSTPSPLPVWPTSCGSRTTSSSAASRATTSRRTTWRSSSACGTLQPPTHTRTRSGRNTDASSIGPKRTAERQRAAADSERLQHGDRPQLAAGQTRCAVHGVRNRESGFGNAGRRC